MGSLNMELKIVINDVKTGKSYKKVLPENPFIGKQIRDKIPGDELGLTGYELELCGGSDGSGFGMRPDLPLAGKKKLLLTKGTGVKLKRKGERKRKTVAGCKVSDQTAALNMKITKPGSKSIEDCLGIKKEEKKAPEPKKEEPKQDKVETKEEKPVETKKPEEKKETPKIEEKK